MMAITTCVLFPFLDFDNCIHMLCKNAWYLQEVGILKWQGMVWFLCTGRATVAHLDALNL